MADCVSLPNAAELVEELRDLEYAKGNALSWVTKAKMRSLMLEAADAIEADRMEIAGLRMRRDELYKKIDQLEEQNAKLKAERDAYVQLFSKTDVWKCQFCAHNRQPHRTAFADCDVAGECKNTDALPTHFELRGVQKEEEE